MSKAKSPPRSFPDQGSISLGLIAKQFGAAAVSTSRTSPCEPSRPQVVEGASGILPSHKEQASLAGLLERHSDFVAVGHDLDLDPRIIVPFDIRPVGLGRHQSRATSKT